MPTSAASTITLHGGIPQAGSQIEFDSFEHTARTAERGKFDFFFLAEGLALRERAGQIFDQDIIGRPDTFTVLASLAAVTEHLGLAGTINATFNEPYELARQFATLDQLSGGRAAWNVVTSFDAFTGQNFRRGGYLDRAQRYERAEETVALVRQLWDSWRNDDIVADKASGRFLTRPDAGEFAFHGSHFDVNGRFTVPRSPQGRPVILQGRGCRRRGAILLPAMPTRSSHRMVNCPRQPTSIVTSRLVPLRPDATRVTSRSCRRRVFVLGTSEADAIEKYREIRDQQVTGQTAFGSARTDLESRSVEVRPGRAPTRYRTRPRGSADHPGARLHSPGSFRDRGKIARGRREQEVESARSGDRSVRAWTDRGYTAAGCRENRFVCQQRRFGRIHPRVAPRADRPRRVRRRRGAAVAGSRCPPQ